MLINNPEEYLPEQITSVKGTSADLYKLKYETTNKYNFVYYAEPYYIIFSAEYNEGTKKFDISKGVEPYYEATFEIDSKYNEDF